MVVERFAAEAERAPFGYAGLYLAKDLADNPLMITVIGPPEAKKAAKMLQIIHSVALPRKILTIVKATTELPSDHPLYGIDHAGDSATDPASDSINHQTSDRVGAKAGQFSEIFGRRRV